MPQKANIQSIDAFEQYAMHLKKSRDQINQSAGEIRNELARRMKMIQQTLPRQVNKQIIHWQDVIKQTQQSSKYRMTSEAKEIIRKAKDQLQKLERQKEVLRKWNQKLPGMLEPHQAQIIKFRSYTDLEIGRASETLLRHMKTLDDYTRIKGGKKL